ncbi:MAG: redoxin domain-containing protein [Candidatus Pseudobacter hemicellulosilyticus]|uniref:Redoxin domain-containing protein n=1 Tax=Candidatus Pseudobacter hemicellulosilyticus TaxID=3121375 RepID=A0AAJ6BDI9_9BACT|nr:MAG: redoxin domain-containing protein [Pseudobacter sp.]
MFATFSRMPVILYLFVLITILGYQPVQAKDRPAKNKSIIIAGRFQTNIGDTIFLRVWENVYLNAKKGFLPHQSYSTKLRNGQFHISIQGVKDIAYVSIGRKNNESALPADLLDMYLAEPGDSIFITEKLRPGRVIPYEWGDICEACSDFSFSGRGQEKWTCQWSLEERLRRDYDMLMAFQQEPDSTIVGRLTQFLRQRSYMVNNRLELLKTYEHKLSTRIYQQLMIDIIAATGQECMGFLQYHLLRLPENTDPALLETVRRAYQLDAGLYNFNQQYFEPALWKSAYTGLMIASKSLVEARLTGQHPYTIIKQQFSGRLRDKYLTAFLTNQNKISNADSLMEDALLTMHTPEYQKILRQQLYQQRIGAPVYNFALKDSLGNTVQLSDFRGKYVLIDFYFVGCSGCSYYFQHKLSKAEAFFHGDSNIVFMTVSIDTNPVKWHKGLASGEYTSPMAINLNTGPEGINHPVIKQLLIQAYPSPTLVDRQGNLLINDTNTLLKCTAEELIRTLQHVLAKGS